MILVIDNYDSFTFNLVHYLIELGADVRVERNDALSAADALATGADAILISPGPCTPNEAGISLDLVGAAADAGMPLLGVCLGHQAIGQHFGGKVVRGGLMHGKTCPVEHDGTGLFAGLPSPFVATRYPSLIVTGVPDALVVNATASGLQDAAPDLPPGLYAPGAAAYDMMYGAQPTAFMKQAEADGAALMADGLGMLVGQAAESFFIWHGLRPDPAPVLAALRADLAAGH